MGFANPPVGGGGQYIRSATLVVAASDSKDTLNVDYICDGTDDHIQINQAIAALPAGGGLIHLLEGTYNVSASITLASNVAIIGTGANTVITIPNGFNANINIINAPNVINVLIKDLRIDGNRANQTAGVMEGIYFDIVTHSKVVGCWAENLRTRGIYLSDAANNNTITGNTCQGNIADGIYLSLNSNNTVTGNTCQSNGACGICLYDTATNNTITGNTCQGNGTNGIYLFLSSNNTITGNTCQGNGTDSIYFADSENNTITGNTCQGNGTNGIYLAGSNNNTVVGNTVSGNSLALDNTYDGIIIDNNSDYNNVQGNTVRTTVGAPPPNRQRYGINIANANCDGNYIGDNDLWQSGQTAAYQDLGTNTRGPPGAQPIVASTLVVAATDSIDPTRADYQCDGASDETEINAAITALGATGGTVKLLEGTFTVDGDIVLASNVALVGQGAGTVITIPNGHNVNINIVSSNGIDHVLVKDLRVDGNRANQGAGNMYGIYFDTVTHSEIVNCWVENLRNSGIYLYDGSNNNSVIGNNSRLNTLNGILLYSSSNNSVIGNNSQTNDANGIRLDSSSNYNIITGNNIQSNDTFGIALDGSDHNLIADNEIINNGLFADVTYDGIYLINSDYNNIQGNTIRTTTAAPLPNRQRYGINISNAACDVNLVKDNDLYQSGQTGAFQDLGTDTRLPSIEVPIFDDTDAAAQLSNIGDHVSIRIPDDANTFTRFNFRVPDDFHQLVRARVVVVPIGTGDLNWGCTTDWGACGEAYSAGSDAIAVHVEAVTANEVECLDINLALDGIAAGDHVGVTFMREFDVIGAVHLLQFWMQYV